jgi:hypothetical protein
MTTLVVVAAGLFACAMLCILIFAATLLAGLISRLLPALHGTFLWFTLSDVGRALRRMPLLPRWLRRRAKEPLNSVKVMLALNPTGRHPEYLKAFDPRDHLLFTRDRRSAMLFDPADTYAMKTLRRKLDDNTADLFLVLAGDEEVSAHVALHK